MFLILLFPNIPVNTFKELVINISICKITRQLFFTLLMVLPLTKTYPIRFMKFKSKGRAI